MKWFIWNVTYNYFRSSKDPVFDRFPSALTSDRLYLSIDDKGVYFYYHKRDANLLSHHPTEYCETYTYT